MSRRTICGIMLALLLAVTLSSAFNVNPVRANGTICIRADGSIDPITASITTSDNVTYTFTDNIVNDSIVVERDNIVIDGSGYTLQGTGATGSRGIALTGRTNVTIQNTQITTFTFGIMLDSSSSNSFNGNNMTNNAFGIYLYSSSTNSISGNNVTACTSSGISVSHSYNNTILESNIEGCDPGIYFEESIDNLVQGNNMTGNEFAGILLEFYCSGNSICGNIIANATGTFRRGIALYTNCGQNFISGNTIVNNTQGIVLVDNASNNRIYHNNLLNNVENAGVFYSGSNLWNLNYPYGGNYWSDYSGADADSDGIGDTPYIIDGNNQDNYPLMEPWQPSHDVAAIQVASSRTIVGQGYSTSMYVTLENQGDFTETFNITVYANATSIATIQTNLPPTAGSYTPVTFTWNTTGFSKGNYSIYANVAQVLGETDTTDNALTGGWVYVGVPCDLTGPEGIPDGICNMRDISYMCTKFLKTPTSGSWDPNCDVTGPTARVPDDKVDMRDIADACSHFGETGP